MSDEIKETPTNQEEKTCKVPENGFIDREYLQNFWSNHILEFPKYTQYLQDKTDPNSIYLKTENKTIIGAINEINNGEVEWNESDYPFGNSSTVVNETDPTILGLGVIDWNQIAAYPFPKSTEGYVLHQIYRSDDVILGLSDMPDCLTYDNESSSVVMKNVLDQDGYSYIAYYRISLTQEFVNNHIYLILIDGKFEGVKFDGNGIKFTNIYGESHVNGGTTEVSFNGETNTYADISLTNTNYYTYLTGWNNRAEIESLGLTYEEKKYITFYFIYNQKTRKSLSINKIQVIDLHQLFGEKTIQKYEDANITGASLIAELYPSVKRIIETYGYTDAITSKKINTNEPYLGE